MDLRKELLKEHNKQHTHKIADYVGDSPIRFKALIDLFLSDSYRLAQRAAWPLMYCSEAHPSLVIPYLPKLLKMLQQPELNDTLKRNIIRSLQFTDIPKKHQGLVADSCFTLLADPKEAIAVRVFSMTVLANLAKEQPDLRKELKIIIEDQMPYASAAFISRGRKILKWL